MEEKFKFDQCFAVNGKTPESPWNDVSRTKWDLFHYAMDGNGRPGFDLGRAKEKGSQSPCMPFTFCKLGCHDGPIWPRLESTNVAMAK